MLKNRILVAEEEKRVFNNLTRAGTTNQSTDITQLHKNVRDLIGM
jgi:hypothetical protein